MLIFFRIRGTILPALLFACALAMPSQSQVLPPPSAQSCPFDDGHSSLEVEGLILTRYAMGITGAPLVAKSGIDTVSAQTVQDSINSQVYDLRLTQRGSSALVTPDSPLTPKISCTPLRARRFHQLRFRRLR